MRLHGGLLAALLAATGSSAETVNGDGSIRTRIGTSDVVVATSARFAGAIHSFQLNGMEYIDSADHGRELQSACSFDLGLCAPFWAERFNPTEAGSRLDGANSETTSDLMGYSVEEGTLRTVTRMAFWLAPGERSNGRLALNTNTLSSHVLRKRVAFGVPGFSNVLDYAVEFVVPITEYHQFAQFEALTGYMPPAFSRFLTLDPSTGQTTPLSDGPGEQPHPVILATEDGAHAMGILALPADGCIGPGYGRWRFVDEKVNKWNAVFRVRDADGLRPGGYRFQLFVPFGSLEEVRTTLTALVKHPPAARLH